MSTEHTWHIKEVKLVEQDGNLDTLINNNKVPFPKPTAAYEQSGLIPWKNRYRIFLNKRLGRGGMATVYRGYDDKLDRPVAAKVLELWMLGDSENRARFEREAITQTRLEHPNIARVYDFVCADSIDGNTYPVIIMELLEGDTLQKDLHVSKRRFKLESAVSVVSQLCSVADYIDSEGVNHRDFKPGNVIVSKDNTAKVIDFGVCTLAVPKKNSYIIGTPTYVAPELQRDDAQPNIKTDIYSIGIIAYELLTNSWPFVKTTPFGKTGLLIAGQDIGAYDFSELFSRRFSRKRAVKLKETIEKAMNPKPELRYDKAADFASDLASAAD